MLTFVYTARDTETGKQIKSTVQAESERSAAKLLMAQNLIPLKIQEETKSGGFLKTFANHVPGKERIIFTRQLSTLINAGLPLAQSLHTVADQTTNKRLNAIINGIITDVEGGNTLADSFGKYPDIFNGVYLALIAAGETSGTLDKALERIANQQEKDAEMLSKVRGALIYPVIVLVVILGVIVFMMVTVVPQIEHLYHDLKQPLPFITAAMVGISNFVINFWWVVLIVTALAVYFLRQYFATDAGKHVSDTFRLRVPIFGKLFQKLYMARFTRSGETLMSTGVPMLEMLSISARAVNNSVVAASIGRAAEKVKGGKSLSSSLKGDDNILPLVPQMLNIGEQSGGIDKMMGKAATFYENDLDNAIKSISTAIEPVLMVVLAVVAGLMVGAILIPVYGLINTGALNG